MKLAKISGALLVFVGAGIATADQAKKAGSATGTIKASVKDPITLAAKDLKWSAAPPSLPPGASAAILDGDPATPDRLFTMRLKVPANYRIMPHWHPADEHVTVISGEFRIGHGDKFDPESMQTQSAGGYFVLPANHRHFAMASRDAVVQLHGVGPWAINYVNAADDPRNAPDKPRAPKTSQR